MIFLQHQTSDSVDEYRKLLSIVGSLSNLFSESASPYIDSRISEKMFCRVFEANDLGRSDISADASKQGQGVGIKTFLENNGRSIQKIAEFNRDRKRFENLKDKELVFEIAHLRNKRIEATKNISDIDELSYHCITRTKGLIRVFEKPMNEIQIDLIKNIDRNGNVVKFTDDVEEYSFNISKSVLMKRFVTPKESLEVPVTILEDPFDLLEKFFNRVGEPGVRQEAREICSSVEMVILPMYSARSKKVEEKSGLNQWNAGGRARQEDEVYIPIPKSIHTKFPNFFPPRDSPFKLKLPSGKTIVAKVCQEGGKALMSNPNTDLGKWLLRDVLQLKSNELLTTEKLEEIGLDSVQLSKLEDDYFEIDFKKLGAFEEFQSQYLVEE